MFTPRQNIGHSAATAIVIDDSEDDPKQRTTSKPPPAKRRKLGPFEHDSDSDTAEEEVDADLRERIAALKTEDPPVTKEPKGEVAFASRSNAPVISHARVKPEQTEDGPKPDLATFLSTSIPTHIITASDREVLVAMFNTRLDLAESEDVTISTMAIGEDCLPTWPRRAWGDPVYIKEALEWRAFAQGFGDNARKLIREKVQRRLDQAVGNGIEIKDLMMNEDLRLEWQKGGFVIDDKEDTKDQVMNEDAEGNLGIGDDISLVQDSGYFTGLSQSSNLEGVLDDDEDLFEPVQTPSIGPFDYDADDDASETTRDENATLDRLSHRWVDAKDLRDLKPVGCDHYFDSSSSESDDDEDDETAGEDPRNIFYGAKLVGADPEAHNMDFEVYLAPNDSDLDEMPELEVMIDDEEAYEYHNPEAAAEVFDFPLPEGQTLRVTDEHLISAQCSGETQLSEETDRRKYASLPRWAHPDVVLEGIKRRHWTRASQEQRDKWQREIDKALAEKPLGGELVDLEETDEEAMGCENEEEAVSDESDVSVEDESGDEVFKPVKRKFDEDLRGQNNSGEQTVVVQPEAIMGQEEALEKELDDLLEQDTDKDSVTVMDDVFVDDQCEDDEDLFEDVLEVMTEDQTPSQEKDTLVDEGKVSVANVQATKDDIDDDELFEDVL